MRIPSTRLNQTWLELHRPGGGGSGGRLWALNQVETSANQCHFCRPQNFTVIFDHFYDDNTPAPPVCLRQISDMFWPFYTGSSLRTRVPVGTYPCIQWCIDRVIPPTATPLYAMIPTTGRGGLGSDLIAALLQVANIQLKAQFSFQIFLILQYFKYSSQSSILFSKPARQMFFGLLAPVDSFWQKATGAK